MINSKLNSIHVVVQTVIIPFLTRAT